jgi:hypothetical protein
VPETIRLFDLRFAFELNMLSIPRKAIGLLCIRLTAEYHYAFPNP